MRVLHEQNIVAAKGAAILIVLAVIAWRLAAIAPAYPAFSAGLWSWWGHPAYFVGLASEPPDAEALRSEHDTWKHPMHVSAFNWGETVGAFSMMAVALFAFFAIMFALYGEP